MKTFRAFIHLVHEETLIDDKMAHGEIRELASEAILVEPLLKFSSKLFQSIAKPSDNVIFSPLSIHVCLNMYALGVSQGSKTAEDMSAAMGYMNIQGATVEKIHQTNAKLKAIFNESKTESRSALLGMINHLIVNDVPIEQAYIDKAEKYYRSSVKQITSSCSSHRQNVIDEINEWCKKAGLSENFLTLNDLASSHLILVNAVRVESEWFHRFAKCLEPKRFYNYGLPAVVKAPLSLRLDRERIVFFELTKNANSAHRAINAAARNKSPQNYDDLAELEFRVIRVRLMGDLSYTIVEPIETVDGAELAALESALATTMAPDGAASARMGKLNDLVDSAGQVLANLVMPGFKYEQDVDLKDHLKAIGLRRLFDTNVLEDTREMTPLGFMAVGAKHRALIEVNEKGIRAAAITKMMLVTNCSLSPEQAIDIKVENPFMFLLRLHKLPLFVGHFVHC